MTVTPFDRILVAFRAFVGVELAKLLWLGAYEYSIVASGSNTVDVTPVDTSIGLPAATKVPLRSGLLGQTVTATPGSLAIVRFVNGDPSRPVCTGITGIPSSSSVDATQTVQIGPSADSVTFAGGELEVATVGTGVSLLFPPGCAVQGSIAAGPPIAVTSIAILNGLGAMVMTGSQNVTAPPPAS